MSEEDRSQSSDLEDSSESAESENRWLNFKVSHRQMTSHLTLPLETTVKQLFEALEEATGIPVANQKIMVPKGPMMKPPSRNWEKWDDWDDYGMCPSEIQDRTLRLIGSASSEVRAVQSMCEKTAQRTAARTAQRPKTRPRRQQAPSADDIKYTFLDVRPLAGLPRPEKSLALLMRLKADPGIRATMKKRRYTVALLTEMEPLQHTQTSHEGTSRTLGLNRNKGEVIELRLRTDAHDGYRDYKTIRKTLCHELAHNVHSDHDAHFWDLCRSIEREVDAADWKTGGHTIAETSRYLISGQEEHHHSEEEDGGGWTGGEFVLGGGGRDATTGGGITAGLSRREVLAQAALERQRKETQEEARAVEAAEKGWRPCQRQQPSDESKE